MKKKRAMNYLNLFEDTENITDTFNRDVPNGLNDSERAALVDSAMGYAIKLAKETHKRLKNVGIEIDLYELTSEAKLALVEQSHYFDPDYKGRNGKATFCTFVHFPIKNKINQYIQRTKSAFREVNATKISRKFDMDTQESKIDFEAINDNADLNTDSTSLGDLGDHVTDVNSVSKGVRDWELDQALQAIGQYDAIDKFGEITKVVMWLFICRKIDFPSIADQLGLNLAKVQTIARNVIKSINKTNRIKEQRSRYYEGPGLFDDFENFDNAE